MYITNQTHGDDACFVIIVLESRDRKRVDRALAPLLNKNACGLSTRLRMDSTEDRNNDTHVRLLVKAPDQQIDDQIVQCKLDWSVAMLKDHLAQVYPGNPRHTDQKIIFSGQLLSDSMILKDVLQQYYNKDDRSFIVHLVCGGQWRESTTAKTKTNIGISGSGNTTNVQSPVNATAAPSPPQPTPVEQYYSQLNNQQMAWMQQAYAHYLTQYTQFMATQGIQFQSTSPYPRPLNAARASDAANNNNAVTNNNNAEENDDNEDRAARGARVAGPPGAAAAGDANAVNNNNNVPADEAPGGAALNRDWLDIIDMLSRIVVLSSIVYFYSSPSRFLIVTFLGFVIYLVQGGFFRGQPVFLAENNNARVENNNQLGQNEPAGQAPAAQIPPQQAPRNATAVPAGGHGEAARTNVNEENERPGAWAFTWTFFSSFFASLIPDQPNVI